MLKERKLNTLILFGSLFAMISIVLIEPALAQAGGLSGAESILSNIVDAMTGPIAKSIAVIAVIIIGFAFFFGYVDFRTVGYFVVGAILVFGADEIVDLLSGGAAA